MPLIHQTVAVVQLGNLVTHSRMAVSGNSQKLDCLPLLTLGEMLQEKMVHQSEALWALGSKAEKWGRGDCASSHFHCCMMGKLPLPSQKSFVNTKWTVPWKLKFQSRTVEWEVFAIVSFYTVPLVFFRTRLEQQWKLKHVNKQDWIDCCRSPLPLLTLIVHVSQKGSLHTIILKTRLWCWLKWLL